MVSYYVALLPLTFVLVAFLPLLWLNRSDVIPLKFSEERVDVTQDNVTIAAPVQPFSIAPWATVQTLNDTDVERTLLPAWGRTSTHPPPPPLRGMCDQYSFAGPYYLVNGTATTDMCVPTHSRGSAVRCYTERHSDGRVRNFCDTQNIAIDVSALMALRDKYPTRGDSSLVGGDCRIGTLLAEHYAPVRLLIGLVPGPLRCDKWISHPVILLARWGTLSTYHVTEDLEALFTTFTALGATLDEWQVVTVDMKFPGLTYPWQGMDLVFINAFSQGRPIAHISELKPRSGSRVCFRRAVFAPCPTRSLMSVGIGQQMPCGQQDVYPALARHILATLHLTPALDPERVRITFTLRSPSEHEGLRHFANQLPGVQVEALQFGQLPIRQQIAISMNTDILVGTHGAGLTFLIYMPRHGAVLELPRRDRMNNFHFRNMALLSGLLWEPNAAALQALINSVAARRRTRLPAGVPPNGRWHDCAGQGGVCQIPRPPGLVRLGAGTRWTSLLANASSVQCDLMTFGENVAPLTPVTCQRYA